MADKSDIIRLQTEMFAEMLRVATVAMADDAVDSGGRSLNQQFSSDDVCDSVTTAADDSKPSYRCARGIQMDHSSSRLASQDSSLSPEQVEECRKMALKLDMVADEINEKYVSIAQQRLKSASSYSDFETAISEAFRNCDPTTNQIALLFRLARDAAAASWTSAGTFLSWAAQFFQQRLATKIVEDNKSLKTCVEEVATNHD